MASYFTFDPGIFPSYRAQGGAGAGSVGPLWGNSAAFGPLARELQRSAATFWDDNAGRNEEERTLNRAVNRFRNNFATAWNRYSGLEGQEALDGYGDFGAAIDKGRDEILASVAGPARDMVKPVLNQLHLQAMQLGLAHWDRHDRASNPARVQLARLDGQNITDAPGVSVSRPLFAVPAQDQPYAPQLAQSADSKNSPQQDLLNRKKRDEIINGLLTGKIGNLNWNIEDIRSTSRSKLDPWNGSAEPEGGFETFTNPEDGARAAYINLKNNLLRLSKYDGEAAWIRSKYGRVSVENIAYLLTIASDNREDWIQKVSAISGIPRDQAIDMKDVGTVAALLRGIAIKERGESPSLAAIIAGIRKALFNEPYPEVPLEEQRRRLQEIAKHAPDSGPTKTRPNTPNIKKALNDRLRDIFGYEDLISDLAREQK